MTNFICNYQGVYLLVLLDILLTTCVIGVVATMISLWSEHK